MFRSQSVSMTEPKKIKIEKVKQQTEEKASKPSTTEPPNGSLEDDHEKRGYYYDDAHGYEMYVPEEDEDD